MNEVPHATGGVWLTLHRWGWGAENGWSRGGSCVSSTSTAGREVSTHTASQWEQSCLKGRPWERAMGCHSRCAESLAWRSETTFHWGTSPYPCRVILPEEPVSGIMFRFFFPPKSRLL